MNFWQKYKNGNCEIMINTFDGTRIIDTGEDTEVNLDFPLSMDISIGRRCDGRCQFCYENATPDGPEADLLNIPFLETLKPFTEIAINGNSVNHPQLIPFLEKLKQKQIIANMTVNQIHFEQKQDIIDRLLKEKLIYGLGISLRNATPEFAAKVAEYPTAVIHVINGIFTQKDADILGGNDLKLLILGYKMKGRGDDYYYSNRFQIRENQRWLEDNVLLLTEKFQVVSFDNLALAQLNVKDKMSSEKWDAFYQGDDGQLSMYIDLVSGTFGKSSLEPKENMMPLLCSIEEMFAEVKKIG